MTQVYVLGAGHSAGGATFMKIGITDHDLRKRISKLQVGCPFDLVPLAVVHVPGNQARSIEKQIHADLAAFKMRGEWFLLNDESESMAKEKIETISKIKGAKFLNIRHSLNKRMTMIEPVPTD